MARGWVFLCFGMSVAVAYPRHQLWTGAVNNAVLYGLIPGHPAARMGLALEVILGPHPVASRGKPSLEGYTIIGLGEPGAVRRKRTRGVLCRRGCW